MTESNSKQIEIKTACEEDLEEVFRIEKEAFSAEGTEDSPEIIRLRWETFPAGFIVGKVKNKVVAYASSEKWKKLGRPKLYEDPRKLHASEGKIFCITSLAVAESQRGNGVGSRLLARLVKIAALHECSLVVLETVHAKSFYEKHGFTVSGTGIDSGHHVQILSREIGKLGRPN